MNAASIDEIALTKRRRLLHRLPRLLLRLRALLCPRRGRGRRRWLRGLRRFLGRSLRAAFAVGEPEIVDRMLDAVQSRTAGVHPSGEDAAHLALQRHFIDFHESIGVERKAARLRYLRRLWTRRLQPIPSVTILNHDAPEHSCGIGAMQLRKWDSGELTAYLMKEHRIHVRARYVPGEFDCIRVTPNIYSTPEEIEAFVQAIEAAIHKKA